MLSLRIQTLFNNVQSSNVQMELDVTVIPGYYIIIVECDDISWI